MSLIKGINMIENLISSLKISSNVNNQVRQRRSSKKSINKTVNVALLGFVAILFVSYQIYELISIYKFRL